MHHDLLFMRRKENYGVLQCAMQGIMCCSNSKQQMPMEEKVQGDSPTRQPEKGWPTSWAAPLRDESMSHHAIIHWEPGTRAPCPVPPPPPPLPSMRTQLAVVVALLLLHFSLSPRPTGYSCCLLMTHLYCNGGAVEGSMPCGPPRLRDPTCSETSGRFVSKPLRARRLSRTGTPLMAVIIAYFC